MTNEQEKIKKMCLEKLSLEEAKLSNEYYYNSIVFCLIDAIFSIGIRYSRCNGIFKPVFNYCKKIGIESEIIHSPQSSTQNAHTISGFIKLIEPYIEKDYGANDYYLNRQRTSTRNGILKAQAVYEAAKKLNDYRIESLEDLKKFENLKELENEFCSIKGQGSGISFKYFLMLSGDDSQMKIDRWLLRFVAKATEREWKKLNIEQTYEVLMSVFEELKVDYPHLTPRLLDHEIWKFAKNNKTCL